MLFPSNTSRDVWIEHNCHKCFQPDEAARRLHGADTCCPILERALRTDRKPKQWDRTKSELMAKRIRCNAFQARPASVRAPGAPRDELHQYSLFDVEPVAPQEDGEHQ